jgi:hypothetical protein
LQQCPTQAASLLHPNSCICGVASWPSVGAA